MKTSCNVSIAWDADSQVYVATSEDVPGLVMENGSVDALIQRVLGVVAELFALNKPGVESPEKVRFHVERSDTLPAAHAA